MLSPNRSLALIQICRALSCAVGTLCLFGQGAAPQAVTPPSATIPAYVARTMVPSNVAEFLLGLGDRIQKPGKERLMLVGTHKDAQGTSPAQLTWEVPGSLRYDRAGPGSKAIVYDSAKGLLNPANVSPADLDILESLLVDTSEAFLYSYLNGHAHRFLGGRFRMDDGKAPNYKGPWYDVYEDFAPVKFLSGAPVHPKLFLFDSDSKLLAKTGYVLQRNGNKVNVSTEYNKWTVTAGNAFPGEIVRKENAVVIFTFTITAAAVGPKANDGLFTRP